MNRILIVVALAVVLGLAAWFGINKDNKTAAPAMDMSHNTSTAQSEQKQQPVATTKISIQNYAFTPASITVKKGASVTWTNDDTVTHTAAENDGKDGPSSPELAPGKTYSFTFNKVGTFNYHCSLHAYMTGVVTVTE